MKPNSARGWTTRARPSIRRAEDGAGRRAPGPVAGQRQRNQAGPRSSPRGARGVSDRPAEDGRHDAATGQQRGADRRRWADLHGQGRQLHGPEFRARHEDQRNRSRTQGNRPGRCRRVGRTAFQAGVAGGRVAAREQAMSITIQGLVSRVSRFAAILGVLAAAGTASAQASSDNAIERIDATQTTTGVVVTIELRNAASGVPASFSVANPARVALDLPQTVNGLGKNLVELNQGDVRSVNVVQAGGRSRVVVNLKRPVTHNITVDGKRVLVAIGGAAGATFAAGSSAPAAAPAAAAPVAAQAV